MLRPPRPAKRRQHYQINLKAELKIRNLHEKMGHLLKQQHRRMLEIQNFQTDLLTDIGTKKICKPSGGTPITPAEVDPA